MWISVIVLVVASLVGAVGTPASASGSGVGGPITKIDASSHSFTLKNNTNKNSLLILTNSSTKFASSISGKVESFKDLRVGEVVVVAGYATKSGFLALDVLTKLSITTGGNLPSGFPKAVPLPRNCKVLGAVVTSSGKGKGFDVDCAVPGSASSVISAYTLTLRSAGFSILTSAKGPGGVVLIAYDAAWSVSAAAATGKSPSYGPRVPPGDSPVALVVSSRAS
ncbi:MAG: hypothetical protein ACYCTE_13930 [Acidimicrobiales bacterium]